MGYNPIPSSKAADLATQLSAIKLTKNQETQLRSSRSLSTNYEVASAGLKALQLRKHRIEQEKQQEREDWLKEFRARQKTLARAKTVRRIGSVKRTQSIKIPNGAAGAGRTAPNFSRKGEARTGQSGASSLQRKINLGRLMRTDSIQHAKNRVMAVR